MQVARNGTQAVEFALRGRPHYVLLDIGLPGMDGYAVAKKLRQDCAYPLVIIAVTGYGREEDRRLAREAGIDHHLIKPTELNALMSVLASSQMSFGGGPRAEQPSEHSPREGNSIE